MKILQINCVYGVGSTGKIVEEIHKNIMNTGNESVVCYGRGKESAEINVHKVSSEFEAKIHSLFSRLFGVDFGYSPIATNHTINIIKKERPYVVHLHCLNGHFINVYKLVGFLKENKIPTILTLHAEIMHTAGCEHAMECDKWKNGCFDCNKIKGYISHYFRDDTKHCYKLMKDAFEEFKNLTVVGVSQWLTDRVRLSPIFKDSKFATVNNGIDTDAFCYRDSFALREKLKINKDKRTILHVTPNFNSEIKGGKYVIELAKKMPDYQFIIVGFNGDKKLLPQNVIPILHTDSKEELAQYYSMANITLLTSKKETFSMVCAESLSCGTPVVGFKAGAPEQISLPEYSEFVEYGNEETLLKAVEVWLRKDLDKKSFSKEAAKAYSKEKMCDDYMKICEEIKNE